MNKLHQTCLICGSLCAIGIAFIVYQHQKIQKLKKQLEFETQRKLMEKSQQEIMNNPNLIFTEEQHQEQQQMQQQEQQQEEQQEKQQEEVKEEVNIPESNNIHENFNIDLSEHVNSMFIPIELNPPTSSTQIEILEVNSENDTKPKSKTKKKNTKKKVKFEEEEKKEETTDNSEEIREFVSDVIKKVKKEITVSKDGEEEKEEETKEDVKEIVMKSKRGRKKPEVEIVKVEEKVEKKKNKWFEHLAKVRSDNPGLTYKEQRKIAQESYKKTG